MAIGYESNGVDFDDIFEPRTTTKLANNGFQVNGVDITNLYESAASGTPASNVGYRVNNVDVGPTFLALGGLPQWDGTLADAPSTFAEQRSDQQRALAELIFFSDGTVANRNSTTQFNRGRWDGNVANAANTQIRFFNVTQVGAGTVNNSAPNYVSMTSSRGILIETIGNEDGRITFTVGLRQNGDPSTERTKDITLIATSNLFGGL